MSHVNKVVVVEHPLFNHRHVIARVLEQTRSTYVLNYWDNRTKGWDDENKRRKIGYVFVLGSEDSLNLIDIDKIAQKLMSWSAQHETAVKQAERQYFAKLDKLKLKP